MPNDELLKQLLIDLYKLHQTGHDMIVSNWTLENTHDPQKVWDAVQYLESVGLVEHTSIHGAAITSKGILFAEKNDLVSNETVSINQNVRFKILDYLAKVAEEHGMESIVPFYSVVTETGITEECFDTNQEVLSNCGFVEWPITQGMSITQRGIQQVSVWRARISQIERYEEIICGEKVLPQQRGHEIERLLQTIIESEEWNVEINVRSAGEEHDLIIHRNTEYYIVECKWEQQPVQPHLVSVLRDRVTGRAGMRGIFVSASGFTDQSVKDNIARINDAMIVLFGSKDLDNIMRHHATFTLLLNDKVNAAITRRQMLIDGTKIDR